MWSVNVATTLSLYSLSSHVYLYAFTSLYHGQHYIMHTSHSSISSTLSPSPPLPSSLRQKSKTRFTLNNALPFAVSPFCEQLSYHPPPTCLFVALFFPFSSFRFPPFFLFFLLCSFLITCRTGLADPAVYLHHYRESVSPQHYAFLS